MPTFNTILTNSGQAKVAAFIASGTPISLTHMAVGDGNGAAVTPVATMTALVRETYRATINELRTDSSAANRILAQLIIPASSGGYTIREVGIFASDGTLFAVANFPDTYKPAANEGAARNLVVRTIIQLANASAVTLTVDTAIQQATQSYVNDRSAWVEEVIKAGKLTPTPTDKTQLKTALRRLFRGFFKQRSNGNVTLTLDDVGLNEVNITTNTTFTLPLANALDGLPFELEFVRVDSNVGAVATIQRAGSNTIEGLTAFTFAPGERFRLISDGTNRYFRDYLRAEGFTPVQQGGGAQQMNHKLRLGYDGDHVRAQVDSLDLGKLALVSDLPGFTPVQQGGGANQLNSKLYFGWSGTDLRAQVDNFPLGRLWTDNDGYASLSYPTGYVKFPNGLILQWAVLTIPANNGVNWVYPVAFPISPLSVQATKLTVLDAENVTVIATLKTSASLDNYPGQAETPVLALAIGV